VTAKPQIVSRTPAEAALRQLIRAFGLLERVQSSYFARFGLSQAQWSVLRVLHRTESEGRPGLRLTDLGEQLLVRPPSVTGIVDRLQKVGLVSRAGVPTDMRAKHVVLTDEGRQLVERVLEHHSQRIDALMAGLTEAEQTELVRLLEKLGQHLVSGEW
jgi:MarR family 2-MHQ and catechol resistance regulon transcriptional repressor